MKKRCLALFLLSVLIVSCGRNLEYSDCDTENLSTDIETKNETEADENILTIGEKCVIVADVSNTELANMVQMAIRQAVGIVLPIVTDGGRQY